MIHYFKKKCVLNNNVKSLTPLFRRVVVVTTAMKKAYEKPTPTLMNLI